MKVKIICQGQVHEFEGPSLVLVTDNSGTPVSVASEIGVPDTLVIATVNDSDFNETLRKLSLDRTVIVKRQSVILPPSFSAR